MMNTQLPLQILIGHWGEMGEYEASEPPQMYRTVEALPTLKERLQYFNDNICSLALSTKDATYWGWYKKILRVYSPEPCKCGKCRVFTDADKALFEKMRAAEVKRLEKELDKRQTYGEKVAYLITQRGFGLSRLEIAEFDLRPEAPERAPEDVAAFNELSKAAFEERYLPELYNGLRFEKERTRISLQIKEALNPQSIIGAYRKEIIQYVGFDPQDDSGQSYLDAKERLYPTRPTDPIAAAQWDGERIMNYTREIEAKRAFLDLAGGGSGMPDLSEKPLSDADWEALEHGRQVYELYRWLAAWKPGEDAAPEPEPEEADNNSTRSTIEEHLEPYRVNMSAVDFDTLTNALQHYLETEEFPEIEKPLQVNGRPNKKAFGWAINRIFDAQGKGIDVKILHFMQGSISIFRQDKFDKNDFRKSNLYKYFTSKAQ